MSLSHRTGAAKAGPQTARLVPCAKSQFHGFHPENERCALCPDEVARPWSWSAALEDQPFEDWWVDEDHGFLVNACVYPYVRSVDVFGNPTAGYIPLAAVKAYSDTAKEMCTCVANGRCRLFRHANTGVTIPLHSNPQAVKDPGFKEI